MKYLEKIINKNYFRMKIIKCIFNKKVECKVGNHENHVGWSKK